MKKLRVTYELIDEKDGEVLYYRQHEMRPSDGWPGRGGVMKHNGSGLQIASHEEAVAFWKDVVMFGFLDDDYVRPHHDQYRPRDVDPDEDAPE